MKAIEIAGRIIGPGFPCFIIAEAGVNHNGSLEMAFRLVDAAIEAGADAVKFQTFKANRVISAVAPKAEYQVQTTGAGETQLDMVKRLELPAEAFRELWAYCQEQGIRFMSTPFDEDSVDLLNKLGMTVFKIGSGEITNWPFLEYVAHQGKPIILSTGMSFLSEVDEAVRVIQNSGNAQLALMHCVSNYPADVADVNLRAMRTMATAFDLPVGFSDHTLGIEVAMAATALGACMIEKHFTLDHNLVGPDHRASLEPGELKALVRGIHTVEAALGNGRKEPAANEFDTVSVARRSLVAAQYLPAGTILTKELIAIKRPGTGLPPAMRSYLVGRTVRLNIPADTILTLDMLA